MVQNVKRFIYHRCITINEDNMNKSASISKKIWQHGNSIAFTIPKAIIDYLDLKAGDMVDLKISKKEGDPK